MLIDLSNLSEIDVIDGCGVNPTRAHRGIEREPKEVGLTGSCSRDDVAPGPKSGLGERSWVDALVSLGGIVRDQISKV